MKTSAIFVVLAMCLLSFAQVAYADSAVLGKISYWSGKVNQHTDASGTWATDSDGSSGANINTLAYCKKFYPGTTSVADGGTATISGWLNAGNAGTGSACSTSCTEPNSYCGVNGVCYQNIRPEVSDSVPAYGFPSYADYICRYYNENLPAPCCYAEKGNAGFTFPMVNGQCTSAANAGYTATKPVYLCTQTVQTTSAQAISITSVPTTSTRPTVATASATAIVPTISTTSLPVGTLGEISYWHGKVNQHTDANGAWATDPDGVSGANIDMLAYCKKWYPDTGSIQNVGQMAINGWANAGNVGSYNSTKDVYACVNGNSAPASVALSASSTQIISGNPVTLTWQATGAERCAMSASPSNSDWNAPTGTSGSRTISSLEATTVFSITCFDVQANDAPVASSYQSSQVTVNVISVQTVPTNESVLGKISYWWGKVNQHTDGGPNGAWTTDPDGISGADLDMLAYCQKWYPSTTSVQQNGTVTMSGWMDGGNAGNYTTVKPMYLCMQGGQTQIATCTDSDGGLNYDVQGTVNDGSSTGVDYCNGNFVVEAYCAGNALSYQGHECAYGCSNGACMTAYNTSTNDTNDTPPAPPESTLTYTGHLFAGWNMVTPTNDGYTLSSLASQCSLVGSAWHYSGQAYEQATAFVLGQGYWVKAASNCDFTMTGNAYPQTTLVLSSGWNQLGVAGAYTVPSGMESCVTSGPWYYDTVSNAYAKTALGSLTPGVGYWIKSSGKCLSMVDANPVQASTVAPTGGRSAQATATTISTIQMTKNKTVPSALPASISTIATNGS